MSAAITNSTSMVNGYHSQMYTPGSVNVSIAPWPATAEDKTADVNAVADQITDSLGKALNNNDFESIGGLFFEDGYWRDHLALSWKLRTLKGRANIVEYLRKSKSGIDNVEISRTSVFRSPKPKNLDHLGDIMGIEFFITFRTKLGSGQGVVRLGQDAGRWKIWTFFTSLEELDGHGELLNKKRPNGVQHGESARRKNWLEKRVEETNFQQSDPLVLIIGAGQAGLGIHARLKMLNISALIIDTNAAVGDNWRKRYHQLVLHDPVWFDHMPYLPFPPQWPIFTPKDKLADFFESYAKLLELNVWTKTSLESSSWDEGAKTWTVELKRTLDDGSTQMRKMSPRHVILATGHSGEKNYPTIKGMNTFQGDVLCHSSEFPGAKKGSSGRRAVVVGSCNSSHDICQDYFEKGYNITMIQRSSTCVVSSDSITRISLGGTYEEGGPPVEDADLSQWATPSEVLKAQHIQVTKREADNDRKTLDGLEKAGFKLDNGPDDSGLYLKYLQRGGGYYIDVGASQLISDGKIKVKQGHEVVEILPQGLRFDNGEELPADEIVFATGYQNMRTQARAIMGDEVAERIGDVWGFNEEGEMRGIWSKTGHPGFWVHGGNLAFCRYYSRLLALQIKALAEGICRYDDM